MVKLFCFVAAMVACGSSAHAQCGGVSRATPVRSLIASRPILSTLKKIQTNSMARRMSACQGMTAPQANCTQSAVPAAPCPTCVVPQQVVIMSTVPLSTPIRSAVSSAYQQALASATYRAANRIRGHSYLDTHRTSGVGWATYPNPTTCLGVGGCYASVQGADGTYYSTKFL